MSFFVIFFNRGRWLALLRASSVCYLLVRGKSTEEIFQAVSRVKLFIISIQLNKKKQNKLIDNGILILKPSHYFKGLLLRLYVVACIIE